MKRIFTMTLIMMMLINMNIAVFASSETISIEDIDIPITSSLQITNTDGQAEKYFSDDESAVFKYNIVPKDIPLKSLEEGKPIDVMLVCDISGSMNDDMIPDNWIKEQFTKYDEDNFASWLEENAEKTGEKFTDWIMSKTEFQDESTYETWRNKYAPYVSYAKWKARYAQRLSFKEWVYKYASNQDYSQWLKNYEQVSYTLEDIESNELVKELYNKYVLDKYTYYINNWTNFHTWAYYKANQYGKDYTFSYNGETISQKNYGQLQQAYKSLDISSKYEYQNYYFYTAAELMENINVDYKEEFLYYINKKYIYDGYYLNENQMYSRWLNYFYGKYYYEGKYYSYQELKRVYESSSAYYIDGKSYNASELRNLYDEKYSNYSWLKETDEVLSPEATYEYWLEHIKGKYLYDGHYYSFEEVEKIYESDRYNGYIYKNRRYSLAELREIYDRKYGSKYLYKIDNKIYSISSFDYRFVNNIHNYKKVDFYDSTLQTLWDSYNANTRLDAAKVSMKDFVGELATSQNSSEIELGLVVFYNNAEIKINLSNLLENKLAILKEIDDLRYGGATNSGDGLRLAYHEFDLEKDSDKYMVFLADGDANYYTAKSRDYYYGEGSSRLSYDPSYKNEAVTYLNEMAKIVGNASIHTYVIGVGDDMNESQKIQNQTLARYANYGQNAGNIDNTYFSVMDSVSLANLYKKIAKEIVQRIPISDIRVEIPFETDKEIAMEADFNKIHLKDVKIDGKKVEGFTISNNTLYGYLPNFEYVLDKNTKLYTASPMELEFKIEFADGMTGEFATSELSKITFKVEDKTSEKPLESLGCEVIEGLKPVGVEANFIIDEKSKVYTLSVIPKSEVNEIKIVYGQNAEKSIDICPMNEEKYTVKEYTINLKQEQFDDIISSNPTSFDVETRNDIRLADTGEIVSRIGSEPVSVMRFGGLLYDTDNYLYDDHRSVNLMVNGPKNMNNFEYKIFDGDYTSYSPIFENNSYSKVFDLSIGNKDFTIKATNELGNTTTILSSDFVHARRPEIKSEAIDENTISFKIFTFDGASMASDDIEVKFYDEDGNAEILSIDSLTNEANIYTLEVNFDSSRFIEGTKITVLAKDNYRNVAVIGDGNEDTTTDPEGGGEEEIEIIPEFVPDGFISLVKIGLYDTGKMSFIGKTGEPVSMVMNMRYTYGVDLVYGGQNSLDIVSEKADMTMISAKIIEKDTGSLVKSFIATEDMNSSDDVLTLGSLKNYMTNTKKYLILVNLKFNQNADSYDKIYVKANMGSESVTDELKIISNPFIE